MRSNVIENIYKSSLKFVNYLRPEEAYRKIVEEATKLVGARDGSIFLASEEGELHRAYTSVENNPLVEPRRRGSAYEVYRTRKIIVLSCDEFSRHHRQLSKRGIKSLILIPLSYNRNSIGVLSLLSTEENHFSDEMVRALKLFGSMASLVIRKTQLYQETEDALKARDLLIALMAHELKTPLTALNLQVQMLDNGKNKKIHPLLTKKIVKETRRLIRLVEQFIAVDQIKSGVLQYELHTHNLKDILSDAIEYFKLTYPQYRVRYSNGLTDKDTVQGDSDKLMQALINILNNAAKFSDVNSLITISVSKTDEGYRIKIKDRGRGIPKKDQVRIFERFYQGTNSNREGLGLGLYLAKKIIEKHKGSITVKSMLDKGSIFTILLPCNLYNG